MSALPEGFTLDKPAADVGGGLPPGFSLDTPKPQQQNPLIEAATRLVGSMAQRGPMFGMMHEGMRQGGELLDKAGYAAGGAVTDLTGSPGAGAATNAVIQAAPAMLTGGPAKALGSPAMEAAATGVMRRALKPSAESVVNGDAAKAIKTMFDEGVNVTVGGAAKLRKSISELSAQVADVIKNSPETVNKQQVASELFPLLERLKQQSLPNKSIKAVESAFDEFMAHPLLKGVDEVPVPLAQKMKQGTQRAARDAYGEMGSAEVEANKALGYGWRKGIEAKHPEVAQLNAREAGMINALDQVEQRAAVAGNRDMGGLSWLANNPKAAAAFLADRSPLFKSIVARMMNAGREQIPAAAARGAAGAYSLSDQ